MEDVLLNDVRTATPGELAFGLGKEARALVFFAVGTGIGGGIAADGRLTCKGRPAWTTPTATSPR